MAIKEVKAMLPGIFYRKPSPNEPPYKNAGDKVGEDDTIGLIEVMKSFHEIKAGVNGNIVSFKIEDTQAIAPGDIIAEIEI